MLENISNLSPETIIFGGLTLVSLSLVGLVWRISVRYGNHSSEIVANNTEAWILNAKVQQKHTDCLDNLGVLIKDSNKGVTKSIDELSKVIKNNGKK